MSGWLDATARTAGARVIAALAARFRDIDLAEEAYAEACARAAALDAAPANPAGWLWRVAERVALDQLRARRRTAARPLDGDELSAPPDDEHVIPDHRLRLFFLLCHPALSVEARAALILRLLAGVSVGRIARAFLVTEPAMLQRLTRAKRKIRSSGIPFDPPGPAAWGERLGAILIALDVAYAQVHADAAGSAETAALAADILSLTAMLAELVPDHAEVAALAAVVRLSEARRPARLDADGRFIPLSEQDPARWARPLIAAALPYLRRAVAGDAGHPRVIQSRLQAVWCGRRSLGAPAPWPAVLALYDELLAVQDDVFVRINRAVAVAEVAGAAAALRDLDALDPEPLAAVLPWHAVRADLLRRVGRRAAADAAYAAALTLDPAPAERRFLEAQRARVSPGSR